MLLATHPCLELEILEGFVIDGQNDRRDDPQCERDVGHEHKHVSLVDLQVMDDGWMMDGWWMDG